MNGFDIMNVQVEGVKRKIDDYSWTFYGVGGFGKSSLCAHLFNDPAFYQWEQGQNALVAKKVPAPDWKTIQSYTKTMQKAQKAGKPMPFKTAIMDTVDVAFKECSSHVCRLKGWEHPSDGEWGRGWEAVRTEFEMQMKVLEDLGIKPVYISHDKDKEFTPKKKPKYNQVVPSVPTSAMETVYDKVDFVGYCVVEQEENEDGDLIPIRKVYFRSNGDFKAKSRLKYFPSVIEYGDSPEECAGRIKEAFDKAIIKEFGEDGVSSSSPINFEEPKREEKKPKSSVKKEARKKEKKVEKQKESPKQKNKEVLKENVKTKPQKKSEQRVELEDVKAELDTVLRKMFKDGKMNAVELVAFIEKHTGKKKIGDIDDVGKARKALEEAGKLG